MAEVQELKVESFIHAMRELRQCKLFSDAEIRKLVIKMKNVINKISGSKKQLDDFKAHINLELEVLTILKVRNRDVSGKYKYIEWMFVNRAMRAFQKTLQYFPSDYKLNIQYYDLLKAYSDRFRKVGSDHVKRLIQMFPDNLEIYRKAARWFYQLKSYDMAKQALFHGLQRSPTNFQMYLDLIEFELRQFSDKSIEIIKEYIKEYVKHNKQPKLLLELLVVFEKQTTLHGVLDFTIEQMIVNYKEDPDVWHKLAQKEFQGEYHPCSDRTDISFERSLKRSVERYKQGLSILPKFKKPMLWTNYLDMLIKLNQECTNEASLPFLRKAFRQASNENVMLNEQQFTVWCQYMTTADQALLVKSLEKALETFHDSETLWDIYVRINFAKSSNLDVCEKAFAALGPRSLKIWETLVSYYEINFDEDRLESLYRRATSKDQYPDISRVYKPRYITWSLTVREIDEVRALYRRLASETPYCGDLHNEMFMIEQYYDPADSYRDDVLDLWKKQCGATDHRIYLNKAEIVREKGLPNQNQELLKIHEEARRNLTNAEAKELFKEGFDIILDHITSHSHISNSAQ